MSFPDPFVERIAEPPAPAEQAEAGGPVGVSPEDHERAVTERDEYLDQLRRLKAEFDNYRKRTERDRQIVAQAGARDVVADLLPVMDNLERAVIALGPQDAGVVAGLEMVRGQLAAILSGRGVTEIAAHEQQFDPNVHEAVTITASPAHDDGAVVAVVEKGYRLGETVLRPARVVVARNPEG